MATKRSEPTPWWSWLQGQLKKFDMTAAELERRSNGDITSATISYWKAGPHGAAPDKAIRAAEVLRADVAEALRAAGHDKIADRVSETPPDPVVEEIMGMKRLSVKVRQTLVGQYLDDRAMIERRAREAARRWSEHADEEGGDEAGRVA